MPDHLFPIVRVTIDSYPEQQRATVLREIYAQQMVRFDFDADTDRPLNLAFAARPLGNVVVTSGLAAGLRAQRTRAFLGKESDHFFLGLTSSGAVEARQRGRSATMRTGDAVLMSSAEPQELRTRGKVGYFGMQLPRTMLAPLVTRLDDAVAQRIPRDVAALGLFSTYARSLLSDEMPLSAELAHVATTHLCDLAAVAIGATREAQEVAQGRGLRAARLNAVKQEIAANLGSPQLSLERLAARLGISPSYVRKLFESEETSFSDYVLSQRLLRAYRLLTDPALLSRPIAAIAFEAGFGDLSYFNRAFRRCYGATPSEIRTHARRHD